MRTAFTRHQYIDRDTGNVRDEVFYHDRIISNIYSLARENRSVVYHMVTSRRLTDMLAFINYDMPMGRMLSGGNSFIKRAGINPAEFLESPEALNTTRKFFERKIRFEEFRPMPEDREVIVSPADSRMIIGSLDETSFLFIKEKFFGFEELLGNRPEWHYRFRDGKYAVFRLTPDKYHYNHVPVSGRVCDFYEVEGNYSSCNPGAVAAIDSAYSKNRRTVTIINTDVEGGTGAGYVAMIEVAALMIGDIQQCYSDKGYDPSRSISKGMRLNRGSVKSLFRPGSSVDILLFEKGRVSFFDDIVENSQRRDVQSRFTARFEKALVETDVRVRSGIAKTINRIKP